MEADKFLKDFHDYLAPTLDTYEQAIYLYISRHSRLVDQDEAVVGFKSARKKMAFGIGEHGKPMSENTCYKKLNSLAQKDCLQVLGTERGGTRVHLRLPSEIPGLIPSPVALTRVPLEDMDFFNDPTNRGLLLEREAHRCFYCLRRLTPENYVIEHVLSRPEGDTSYTNVVAACKSCNNRKKASPADDFLRALYRDGLLSAQELGDHLAALQSLQAGRLKPVIPAA